MKKLLLLELLWKLLLIGSFNKFLCITIRRHSNEVMTDWIDSRRDMISRRIHSMTNLTRIGETWSRNIRKQGLVWERFPKVPNGVRLENEHGVNSSWWSRASGSYKMVSVTAAIDGMLKKLVRGLDRAYKTVWAFLLSNHVSQRAPLSQQRKELNRES